MNTVKIKNFKTKMIAHRGLSDIEPENTNASFIAAGNRSYFGIETDIHRTKDGYFVVSHDDSLMRTAGVDINVEESTLAEIQAVTLFDKDGAKDRIDLHPTTLENYIKICKKYEKHSVLELKSEFTDEEIARIIDIIRELDYIDNVTFISFKYDNLTKVRKILPKQSAQFLFRDFSEEILAKLIEDKLDVDICYCNLGKAEIDRFHEAGLTVNAWTVNDAALGEKLAEWGIDYITTNILE